MAKKGSTPRGKPAKAAQKSAGGAEEKELWEEIQKLGGDMSDLAMLQDVDTGVAAKSAKPGKVDKTSLQGDLTEFAKSLGLATSIPTFVGLPESEQKPQQKKQKQKTAEKTKDTQKSNPEDVKTPASEPIEDAGAKGNKKTKSKKAKSDDKPAATEQAKKEEVVSEIPGFKIKSAKDALPVSRAGRLAVDPNPQWFEISVGPLEIDSEAAKPGEDEVLQKAQFAEQLLDAENELYTKSGASKKSLSTSDRSFVSNILTSGTLSDRVAALTLIVQESPVHNLKSLAQLMSMVQKKNRREALMAVGSVKDLMSLNLLPSDRKLKYFADQPLNARGITNAHWIMWAFEDKLKRNYFDLIQVMESMSYDPVLHTRQNMVVYFEELLEQKPEQEQNLLRLLVNKLGDKERQLAAKASFLILRLLNAHPNMKFVVVKTIQELLLTKSSTKERAQYYTMITLNQIILSSKDVQTANLLLEVYFVLFKKLLKITKDMDEAEAAENAVGSDGEKSNAPATVGKPSRKGPPPKAYFGQKALKKAKEETEKKRAEEERAMDNKLLAAILTGLNRALPFSKMEDEIMDQHVGVIFQIAHAGNFNTVVQTLVLLYQIVRARPGIGDRFYRTLYDSLLDPRLDSTSKKAMYLNVLFRALKSDSNMSRVMAFIKRIMQVCLYNQAEFASGALFLVSQILSLNPQIYTMLTQPEDNDGDEKIVDADSEDEDGKKSATEPATMSGSRYDPLKRDPRFADAESSCLWETVMLINHFHPSITHSLKQIFDGEQVPAISNLHNHSLAHFLDRFVFRKPKSEGGANVDDEDGNDTLGTAPAIKASALRGQSIMQPFIHQDGPDTELGPNRTRIAAGNYLIASKRTSGHVGGLDFTSDKIANLQKSEISPDEMFFHQFFTTKKERMGKRVKKVKKDAEDEEESGFADDGTGFASAVKGSAGDDLDEDEVWEAMTASMPKAKGDNEEDDNDGEDDQDEDLLAALQEDDSDNEDGISQDDDEEDAEDDDEDMDNDDEDVDEDDEDGFPNFDDEISDDEDDEEDEDESDEDVSVKAGIKRKDKEDDEAKEASSAPSKRKKHVKLPLFGSFEDYAHMIDNDEGLE
ncbi:CBF/Mak21 family-domain-containing protein [Kickxella alabastrina]|uniref:CBF/Mak21 family-domain-containing protein n=1 Tax=Kickxella alabastrina TaxID=61397 RepID=UPI002220CA2F|nr:CBF/Mak21 family-domain-containing protein [Kickxella alabastrina]KAI7833255.1 CBF/Mak21 family-domain-containing protein [Kickxella alabastrina]